MKIKILFLITPILIISSIFLVSKKKENTTYGRISRKECKKKGIKKIKILPKKKDIKDIKKIKILPEKEN